MKSVQLPRLGDLNPMKIFPINTKIAYERLPGFDSRNVSPLGSFSLNKYRWRSPSPNAHRKSRFRLPRLSPSRLIILVITIILFFGLIGAGGYKHRQRLKHSIPGQKKLPWEEFPRLNGFYNGVGTLVSPSDFTPEQEYANNTQYSFWKREIQDASSKREPQKKAATQPPLDPIVYNPFTHFDSYEYLQDYEPVQTCYLDQADKIEPPEIFAYPGLPQNMTTHFMGSYEELGINDKVCFDRFGRLGPYGYGYPVEDGGVGLAEKSEKAGSDKIWQHQKKIDWRGVDWGDAQDRCYQKNKKRFERNATDESKKMTIPRQAYILRTYTGYQYDEHQLLTLRAMISELSLKSGGEYDVHFLVHVRDNSIPIWTDKEIYRKTLEENVPEEFWGIATLWSEQLMELYYPDPFPDNLANPSGQHIHGVYRGGHFSLQWFAQHHPEYDFLWNWEMDMRYTGHYYEFHNQVAKWAREQPRKGLWERSNQYYIPAYHGSWADFSRRVEEQTILDGDTPVWGPAKFEQDEPLLPHPKGTTPPHSYKLDKYSWGVGEEADLITFNPLFDPTRSTWVFRDDVNGYKHSPPRRAAIITVSRLSKRLLNMMHKETYKMRHSMFPEMIHPSIALHHGLKAVYAPHPMYFDRVWPLDFLQRTFNRPQKPHESPFGGGEHNLLGSSFYYNAGFSGALFRRWWGYRENNEGGTKDEVGGTGRMCLRATLFHPIKKERGPTE